MVLTVFSLEIRAELLFRSLRQPVAGQQEPALRKYANPADVAYPRALADGTEIAAEEVQVFVRGYITPDDVYGAKVMESLVKRGRQTIYGNSVSVAGSGGDVDAAMNLGRVLRRLGVSTVVAPGDECLSSCVFAFMGGDRRMAEGRLGIHRPYFASNRVVPDRRTFYRQLQKRVRDYIEELDFPPSLYEAVMAVPPEAISILGAAEMKKFYLQGMSPSAEDEADAAAAKSMDLTVQEYLQQKAQARPCAGLPGRDGACDREAEQAATSGAAAAESGPAQAYRGALPAVGSVPARNDAGPEGAGVARDSNGAPSVSR